MDLGHSGLIQRYPQLTSCQNEVLKALNILVNCYSKGGKLLVMGNGGSSADAEHLCGELMKGFLFPRNLTPNEKKIFSQFPDDRFSENLQRALPAISLGVGHSFMSAFANDMDPEYVYAQQIWALANPLDVVMGISTSGNSRNVVLGLKVAQAKGNPTIALTGMKESECSKVAQVTIKAPEVETFKVQELHLPIYHALCLELEKHFFSE